MVWRNLAGIGVGGVGMCGGMWWGRKVVVAPHHLIEGLLGGIGPRTCLGRGGHGKCVCGTSLGGAGNGRRV